ncbi:MAG: methylmalonyl Co-A mutase-associated GTPase MeaB [Alphaproteobacteria bacterium]|nr:methylmalonyl Co-A mutase-associated GTPase MeaB [Alphaproteobacteria bacterium]
MTKSRFAPETSPAPSPALEKLAAQLTGGDRRALAKAITLCESERADHQAEAEALFRLVLPRTGGAIRLGLSGPPGAGKSTFIEAFGSFLTGRGHKVAVLAIDPSSRRTGGSILGDKTRMELLSRDPAAFIRPSPSGGSLGGVARRTREAMLLVEAAGFDVVIIETVGVGQSETAVADMADMFMLILSPGGGDELQGIKRGIMELADLVIVNKADGDLLPAARRAAADAQGALHFLRPKSPNWTPEVVLVSALRGEGLEAVWGGAQRYRAALSASGELSQLRRAQNAAWFASEVRGNLEEALRRAAGDELRALEAEVITGKISAAAAARHLVRRFLKG